MSNDNLSGNRGGSRRGRQISFDDDDFGSAEFRRNDYGRRDSDWADDIATRADGRLPYGDAENRPSRPKPDLRRTQPRRSYADFEENPGRPASSDDRRKNNYNDEYMEPRKGFARRHPIIMNILYVFIATIFVFWGLMWFLDYWTFHGEERVVPDVKGQIYSTAAGNVDLSGLRAVITDSVFDSYSRPGTVVEQIPVAGARIKKGGTVYLTIVAFTPKLVTVPDFYNVSVRQARSMFHGLGITDVREVPVVSEYEGLVLGAKFNGVTLQPGARIPVSAVVTIEVGSGYSLDDDFGLDVDTLAIDHVVDELNID